eukprot:scaffold28843_cov135-Isochrysis_galbana.AAC.2
MCPDGAGCGSQYHLEPPASTDSAWKSFTSVEVSSGETGKGLKRGGKRGKDRWEERKGLRVRGGWPRRKER